MPSNEYHDTWVVVVIVW